jgi:hypothetical protein
MKILLIESNLILASRVKNSLSGYDVRVGKDWQGEDRVIAYCGHKNIGLIKRAQELGADLVVPDSKVVDAKSLLWENTEKER